MLNPKETASDKLYKIGGLPDKKISTGNFEQYQRTISQMRE